VFPEREQKERLVWCHWDEQDLGHLFLSAMTAAERIECEDEEEQQPEQQEQEQKSKQAEDQQQSEQQEQEQDQKSKQADEQQQDEKEDTCTTVETTVQVNSYTEEDGVVTQTNHEEAKITQTFIPQEPEPEGPDESVLDGKGEEEECGFCLFMKAGPCGKRFAAWEACVDNADTVSSKIVEKCAQMTHFLKDCMVSNPEYYGPVLQAEKAMDEQAELEGAKEGEEVEAGNVVNSIP